MNADIRHLRAGDAHLLDHVAPEVFDDPIAPASLRRFLAAPDHHLFVALEDGLIVGFVSAMHYDHPDKRTPELWLNEIGVAPSHQGQGIGGALLDAVLAHGRRLGCGDAWVLTDRTNDIAMRLYASRTKEPLRDAVMFTFPLADSAGDD